MSLNKRYFYRNENLINTLPCCYVLHSVIMNGILKLIQRSELGLFFASTLRLQKFSNPASLIQTQANQFRYLSLNNVAFRDVVDSKNEKSTIKKKLKWNKRYSIADDKLIAKQIEAYGRNVATAKKLARELGLKEQSYRAILNRHKFHIANHPTVKGKFSPQEDQTILDYVQKNGYSKHSIDNITILLGRSSPEAVFRRLRILSSGGLQQPKQWTLEDDAIMVKFIVKSFWDKNSNEPPEQIKPNDFENLTFEIQRSIRSVYNHYYETVLPILKTHTKGLPVEENWICQKHLMQLIIDRKIEKPDDINYYDILDEDSFVGQTRKSLLTMVNQFTYKTQNNKRVPTNDILWKRVEKSYYGKTPQLLCFSETRQAQKLERIQNIIETYESAKK